MEWDDIFYVSPPLPHTHTFYCDMFPPADAAALRGKAISVAVVANFGFNLLVTLVFPTMLDTIGSSWTFAIFALIDAYSLYFIKSRVSV